MFTVCPARASSAPHIAPEGPPPTIAMSAILLSPTVSKSVAGEVLPGSQRGCAVRFRVGAVKKRAIN
jgi:hypothetical protein